MGIVKNVIDGYMYFGWTKELVLCHLLRGFAREIHVAQPFFERLLEKAHVNNMKRFLKKEGGIKFFDFGMGGKLPDISIDDEKMKTLLLIFRDVFAIPCLHNDNYQKDFVVQMDKKMIDGPYGYIDGDFDVTLKKGDIVIDAGAWIGDFSAYAAKKGAVSYAFEPIQNVFEWLCKTKELNEGNIFPIKAGLSDKNGKTYIKDDGGMGSSIIEDCLIENDRKGELVDLTTVDDFVREYKLERVDFIKADIEGAERNMLNGASETLRKFAPKLAICTYHLPDDKEVLEEIIKGANAKYKVVHLRNKLFAAVVG